MIEIMPLRDLIDMRGAEEAQEILSTFHCIQDPDIENFLHNRAIDFENIAKSRTYILCNAEQFHEGNIEIYAYFALSLKVLILPEEMSVRSRKEYDGFSGKIHGQPVREIPCYLIGQLARNSNVGKEKIQGSEILDLAMSIIRPSFRTIGGRWVIIECRNDENLIEFYQRNAFKFVMSKPSEDISMVQMIRRVE